MDIPCVKDCPERSATCHAECERYQAYAAWREEERARKAIRARSRVNSINAARATRRKLMEDKKGRKR